MKCSVLKRMRARKYYGAQAHQVQTCVTRCPKSGSLSLTRHSYLSDALSDAPKMTETTYWRSILAVSVRPSDARLRQSTFLEISASAKKRCSILQLAIESKPFEGMDSGEFDAKIAADVAKAARVAEAACAWKTNNAGWLIRGVTHHRSIIRHGRCHRSTLLVRYFAAIRQQIYSQSG